MQNPLQGAASEARLITWPGPQKALLDTALVLGIVAGTSALVFGINVAFAELAGAWYGRGG
jgi:preprotein translocase SecE subunit